MWGATMSAPTPIRPNTAHESVDAFLSYLKRRGRSIETLTKYRPYLDAFAEWAGDRSPASLTTADLDFGFLGAWGADFEERNGRLPSPESFRGVIGALSGLYRFLSNYGFLVDERGRPAQNPALALEPPTIKRKPNDWLRGGEDEALLELSMRAHEEILIWLLRWTGLRLGEALALRMFDVDLIEGVISVPDSKTDSGYRQVPIVPELRPRIIRWINYVKAAGVYRPNGPFLCTTVVRSWRDRKTGAVHKTVPGQAMKPQQVEAIVRRVGERAGIDGRLTPHRLRRTYGSYLLNHDVRLESVSKLLGHANTSITERAYAQLLDSTVKAEVLAALGAR
jgi:integrase/recombinase XerD